MPRKKKDRRGGPRAGAGRPISLLGTKKQIHVSLYEAQRTEIIEKYGTVQKWITKVLENPI